MPVVFALCQDVRGAVDAYPRALGPVLEIDVDQDARAPVRLDVLDAAQVAPIVDRLWFRIDRREQERGLVHEHDRYDVRARVLIGGGQARDAFQGQELQ